MKRVLIVSGIPWSHSNRGIDLITELFVEEGFYVEHLVFPHYYTYKNNWSSFKVREDLENFRQIFSQNSIPFDDSVMFWLPKFVKKPIFMSHLRSVKNVDFNKFDIIVIESGKPVLLCDALPEEAFVIYRQSDPVWIMYKDNAMKEYEKKVYERANLILVPRRKIGMKIPDEFQSKVRIWENGFNVPKVTDYKNPYAENGGKKAVYLGYTPIHRETLEAVAWKNQDCEFHIIGNCISKASMVSISKRHKNVIFHGTLPADKYLGYIKYADFAFVPYARIRALEYIGLNSKFLLFMFFGLPIVSYSVGAIDGNYGIFFVNNLQEFLEKIESVKKLGKIQYNIDWKYYSSEGRKGELKQILSNYREIWDA